ncbi:MAG: hypothetical protein JHC98_09060 [Thermoleophilaceae bacterium]|nr:hypothetical protein [Thermoleophilaceae bacterium]
MAFTSATALASKTQTTVIDDPARILSPDPALQDAALDEIKLLGGDIVKIPVTWRSLAPDGTSAVKPSGDLSLPENYPAGSWSIIDAAVNGAQARGLKVWLMLTAPAPRWAVSKETTPGLGAYQPKPADYAEFVEAVGRKYQSVKYWSFWNEVNLKRFIQPQAKSGLVQSAIHYREMYRAGYKALGSSGNGSDTILFGELLSRYQVDQPALAQRPLTWLRTFFCIDSKGKALKGRAASRNKCAGFQKIKSSGLAYHPYNLSYSPIATEKQSKDNAPIGYLPRVEKVLDQAYAAKHLATRKLKIYNSEYGIQTNPPDRDLGQPLSKTPLYLNVSEYLTWVDPRVATYSQYLLRDDLENGSVSFQTGLSFSDGTKKPGVYEAFQTPMMVFKTRSSNKVTIWGCLRAKTSGTTSAEVQIRSGSDWTTIKTIPVSASSGYFMQDIAVASANSKTFRISWKGGISRTSKPGKLYKPRS